LPNNARKKTLGWPRFIERAATAEAAGRFALRGGATRRISQRRHFSGRYLNKSQRHFSSCN
jgi:hypothetical protein